MIPTSNIIQNLRVESWRVEGAHNKDCWGNKKSHSGHSERQKGRVKQGCVSGSQGHSQRLSRGGWGHSLMPQSTVLAGEITLIEPIFHDFLLDFRYKNLMENVLVFNLSLIFYIKTIIHQLSNKRVYSNWNDMICFF